MPLDSGDFSLVTREVLDGMLSTREYGLFILGIRSWVGYRQVAIEYDREERAKGVPKYNRRKLAELASNGLFGFSHVPIKLRGRVGASIMLICFGYAAYSPYEKIFLGTAPVGFTSLITAIVFLAGVQLVCLRILGEYIVRNYEQSKGRPLYLARQSFLD